MATKSTVPASGFSPTPTADLLAGLGQRLKDERARLDLTQVNLAEKVGITDRAIQHYELGKSTIRLDILYKMREVGVDIDYLLFGGLDSIRYDPALWERVNRWADDACRDRHGRPFAEPVRQQRVLRAYDHVSRGRTPEEVEERLAQLRSWNSA